MITQEFYLKTKDYLVTGEEFNLLHDTDLDMLITTPAPQNLEKYYDTPAYISHQDSSATVIDKIYHFVKSYALNKKIQLIKSYANGNQNLLDIGAGTGDFMLTAKNRHWDTIGVEPNTEAKNKAQQKGLTVVDSLELLPDTAYPIITLWHVLEHLPDLETQLSKIVNLLDPNGTLIIAVPNFKSYDAHYYKTHWAAYDTPRHLWHFSQRSISLLFEAHGLRVTAIKPMKFDSYYVSLLSEKYKAGRTNYFNAFYRGLLSNVKARGTGQYSSLIYILQTS